MGRPNENRRPLPIRWLLILLAFHLPSFSGAADGADPIHFGDGFRFESKVMNETRRYLVHLPKDYAFVKDAYPVLVLLDGDQHFHLVASTVDLLASTDRIPPMIVVKLDAAAAFGSAGPALRRRDCPRDIGERVPA